MINLKQQQSAAAKAYGHRKKLKSLGISEENIGRRMNNVYQNF